MKKNGKKVIPKFNSEKEENNFWESHDSTDYLDWSEAVKMTNPKLKPFLKTISIRLPESVIEELKLLANKRDIHYQSLLKMFLMERVEKELLESIAKSFNHELSEFTRNVFLRFELLSLV